MSTNIARVFSWSAARKRDEMLELYDRKLSRTVLRRESGSNPADLAGTIFGGFAPNSQTAETLSKALGSRTVLSGSVSRGKNDPSQSLQMIERPLLTADELKSIPKGEFVVMKTGCHPMRTRLQLFLDWGIRFEEPYILPERLDRTVKYAGREELTDAIRKKYYRDDEPRKFGDARKAGGNLLHEYDEMIGSGTAFPVEGKEEMHAALTGRRERPGTRSSLKI